VNYLELSPKLYSFFVRPKWAVKLYIDSVLHENFDFTNKRVLDFGCGVGSICSMFSPKDYIGIDCDEKRIKYAQRLHPEFKFHSSRDNKLPVNDNSLDYILISSVLHHIPTEALNLYMPEFHRILSQGGTVLVIEPVFVKEYPLANYYMSHIDKGQFIRTEDEYRSIFHSSNFKTKVIKKYKQLLLYNKIFFTASPN
jgi:ubiquinone/menaquinone biosynthesis C-methylase UbiE